MNALKDNSSPPLKRVDPLSHPQTAKFMDWYDKERQNGLVDIKFFTGDIDGATLESFFGEVNAALASESVSDPDLF